MKSCWLFGQCNQVKMTKSTESDGILKNQDDTSDDASDYFQEPSKLKKRKDGKIYDQYMSFCSLS